MPLGCIGSLGATKSNTIKKGVAVWRNRHWLGAVEIGGIFKAKVVARVLAEDKCGKCRKNQANNPQLPHRSFLCRAEEYQRQPREMDLPPGEDARLGCARR